MKKLMILNLSCFFLLASCGNPHVDKDSPLEGNRSPQRSDEGGESTTGNTTSGSSTTSNSGSGRGNTASGTTTGRPNGGTTSGSNNQTGGGTTIGGQQNTAGTSIGGQQNTGGTTTSGQQNTGSTSTGGNNQNCPCGQQVKLYVGSAADAHDGFKTTGFSRLTSSRSVKIDFNLEKTGVYSKLEDEEGKLYEFLVQSEKIRTRYEKSTMDEIFKNRTYKFKLKNPVEQDRTVGKDMGVVAHAAFGANLKVAAVWRFKKPISYFGATLIDLEASEEVPAIVRIFDCEENLIKAEHFSYPNKENGNREIHFVGLSTDQANICGVSLSVGDYPSHNRRQNTGKARGMAIDDFIFGN